MLLTSLMPNAPLLPSPKQSRASVTGPIRFPTRSGRKRPAITMSEGSPRFLLAVAATNVFNRLNVSTRQPAGAEVSLGSASTKTHKAG